MFLRTFAAGSHVRPKFPHLRPGPTFAAGSQVWAPRFCRRFPRNRRCPRLPQVTTFIPGPTFAKGFPGLAAGSSKARRRFPWHRGIPRQPEVARFAAASHICHRFRGLTAGFQVLPQVPRKPSSKSRIKLVHLQGTQRTSTEAQAQHWIRYAQETKLESSTTYMTCAHKHYVAKRRQSCLDNRETHCQTSWRVRDEKLVFSAGRVTHPERKRPRRLARKMRAPNAGSPAHWTHSQDCPPECINRISASGVHPA